MPRFKVGVGGPVPLEDGRVLTAEDGPFELEIKKPHDQELVDRGVLVPIETATPEQTPAPAPTAAATNAKAGDE